MKIAIGPTWRRRTWISPLRMKVRLKTGSPSRKMMAPLSPVRSLPWRAIHSYSESLRPSSGPMVRSASTIWGIGVGSAGAEGIRNGSAGAWVATVEDILLSCSHARPAAIYFSVIAAFAIG